MRHGETSLKIGVMEKTRRLGVKKMISNDWNVIQAKHSLLSEPEKRLLFQEKKPCLLFILWKYFNTLCIRGSLLLFYRWLIWTDGIYTTVAKKTVVENWTMYAAKLQNAGKTCVGQDFLRTVTRFLLWVNGLPKSNDLFH